MDADILLWINLGWQHPWLDWFFHTVSEKQGFSFPLMAIIVVALGLRFGKDGWKAAVALILLVILGDALGNVLKHLFDQPRPCLEWAAQLHRWDGQPFEACAQSTTGMPSNHALNFFSTFVFMSLLLPISVLRWGFFLLAVCVGLSRIYLGSHFPSQVLAGMGVGLSFGLIYSMLCMRWGDFFFNIRETLNRGR